MGSVYARHRFGIERPKVGLLSIGEEPGKGDALRKEAYELLAAAPGIEFIGNVEGRDMMLKTADVIVTDGFTGNVALKTLEGGLRVLFSETAHGLRRRGAVQGGTPTRCSRRSCRCTRR